MQRSIGALSVVAALGLLPAASAGSDAGDVAAFARHDQLVDVRISPGGTRVAAVTLDEDGKRGLSILDLATHALRKKSGGLTGVGRVHWVSDDRLVIETVDHEGDLAVPKLRGELYAIDADGNNGRFVFGYRAGSRVGEMQTGTHIRKAESDRAWGRVLARVPGNGRKVSMVAWSWNDVGDTQGAIYRLDVLTGVKDLVVNCPTPELPFLRDERVEPHLLVDEEGAPRVACASTASSRLRCFLRQGGDWVEQTAWGAGEPMAYSAKERTLYLWDRDGKGFGVFALSLDSGEQKLLVHNDIAPPSDWALDSAHRLVAVRFDPDLPVEEIVLPDHPLAKVLAGLEASYPEEHVRIVDHSQDDKKVVAEVSSDRDPGRFLVVDAGTLTATDLGQVRPWVNPDQMAEVSAFHMRAGDGMFIHGYVTLPPPPASAPYPMVVLPHGGPLGVRDRWGFDPDAQFLAHQGFAVLQVNFRGSGGYGGGYEAAGFGHWGDRMVQDIIDATRFAIRKGWADPGRICTFGGSYGGYAAIQATILEQSLYRCAVGYAGVYDLEDLLPGELAAHASARAYVQAAAGTDPEALRSASPVHHADQIRVPVLLIHGEEDQRAPIRQAEALRKALLAQGHPPEWLVEPREGHGFFGQGARERLYTRLVEFLRKNTGPQEETPTGAAQ